LKKYALPAILVGIIMIASVFAIVPVNNSTTVHYEIIAALQGINTVRIEKTLDNLEDDGDETWSQIVTYSRAGGTGAWQIEKLFLCDVEENESGELIISFDVETFVVPTSPDSDDPGNLFTSGPTSSPRSTFVIDNMPNGCIDLLATNTVSPIATEDFDHSIVRTPLGGDDDNNVNIRIFDTDCDSSEDEDGAILVAYISGFVNPLDVGFSVDDDFDQC